MGHSMRLQAICCLVVLAVASGALARPEGAPVRDLIELNRGWLLQNESVQKELKLTEEQFGKLMAAGREFEEKHRREIAGWMAEKDPAARIEKRARLDKEAMAVFLPLVKKVLEPAQTERLDQIELQVQFRSHGGATLLRPDIARDLDLTDDQKKSLQDVLKELGKRRHEAFEAAKADPEKRVEALKKSRALEKEATEKALGLLNTVQKKQWQEKLGEPFELKIAAPKKDK